MFAHGLPACIRRHVPPLTKQLMLHNQPTSAEMLTPNMLQVPHLPGLVLNPTKKGLFCCWLPSLHTCSVSICHQFLETSIVQDCSRLM